MGSRSLLIRSPNYAQSKSMHERKRTEVEFKLQTSNAEITPKNDITFTAMRHNPTQKSSRFKD